MEDLKQGSARKGEERPGAFAAFPYDRMTVERFREAFPRARWDEDRRSWFVPGKAARRRVERWLAREAELQDVHGDAKGRDAYAFDPIASPYLEVGDDLRVRTPYSRTVLEQMRAIPWARWDEELGIWRVPFRSYEELRRRWQTIERAARRSEPEARKRHRQEKKGSEEEKVERLRAAERRRRRYPLAAEDLPPLDRPVATHQYGIVVFTEISGEIVEPCSMSDIYPHTREAQSDFVWGTWRTPTLAELVATWPARHEAALHDHFRGWWQPTLAELRTARRNARSLERRRQMRERHRSF
ncbi:hypothetical protein [Sinorhizobium saheli]|uniref:HARP domain-containing protein n=1 Tax=Sinorhizobium saheli TaxID=36856 RepID=A0A178YQI2_SINSA|nr:hypothetical protein [Sinorhizobium saheli]MQW89397.1 hypothetical protein [Sinorhizobium saheli]OAP49123.1 hypothetical protein ATB98_12485 [Sinorhizobium saheli]